MEVNIGEINSAVRMIDGPTVLSPEIMEQIVRRVMERLREEQEHLQRAQTERALSQGVSYEES